MYAYFTITIPPYITFQLWCAYDIASSQWSSSLLSLLCHNSRTYDTLVELLYGIAGWPCLRIESETKRNVCVHLPYKIHMALALWMMDTREVINFCVRPLGRKKKRGNIALLIVCSASSTICDNEKGNQTEERQLYTVWKRCKVTHSV